jgi:hypothetical protein
MEITDPEEMQSAAAFVRQMCGDVWVSAQLAAYAEQRRTQTRGIRATFDAPTVHPIVALLAKLSEWQKAISLGHLPKDIGIIRLAWIGSVLAKDAAGDRSSQSALMATFLATSGAE